MIHSYDERRLDGAMTVLAEAADFSVNVFNMSLDSFFTAFIRSGIAEEFEKGNVKYISGMSGVEIAMELFITSDDNTQTQYDLSRNCFTEEYWVGWIICYCQWKTNARFKDILNAISAEEIRALYHPLHEAGDDKFVDVFYERLATSKVSRLQKARKCADISQAELARRSGVNLRTLQQYESRAKNINNAALSTVMDICRALHCDIGDIIEIEA